MIKHKYDDAVRFHGHSCPGLAIGYRVALAALGELSGERSRDEEFVAIVENNACGVDAIQFLCGCTSGKGNLIFKDYGKHVYTFFSRTTKQGIRIYADTFYMKDDQDARFVELSRKINVTPEESKELETIRMKRVEKILEYPKKDFLKISPPSHEYPERAKILNSFICCKCQERVMETRVIKEGKKCFCYPCYGSNGCS